MQMPTYLGENGRHQTAQGVVLLTPGGAAQAYEPRMIALGLVPGARIVQKFGCNPSAKIGEDVWGGSSAYTGQPLDTEPAPVEVKASSRRDSGSFTVIGLDEDWKEAVETIEGVSAGGWTASKGKFVRIHSGWFNHDDKSLFNAGTIECRSQANGNAKFLHMGAGGNQTNDMVYTVPANRTALLLQVGGQVTRGSGTGKAAAKGSIWVRTPDSSPRLRRPFTLNTEAPYLEENSGGVKFPEKTDLRARIESVSANGIDIRIKADILVIDPTIWTFPES